MRRWNWLLVAAAMGGCATGTTESEDNELVEDGGGGSDPGPSSGAGASSSSSGAGGDPSTSATTTSSNVATTTASSGSGGGGASDRVYFMDGGGTATVGSYTDLTANTGWATPLINDPTVDPVGIAAITGGFAVALIRVSSGELKVTYHAGGMTWSSPMLLSTASPGGSSLASEGTTVHALWLQGTSHVYGQYNAGTWGPVAEVTGGLTSTTPAPAAVTVLASDPVILYVGPDAELYDQTRTGGIWTSPHPHGFIGTVATARPAIAALDAGPELIAVYVDDATDEVRWIARTASVWSAPLAVPGATSTDAPSLIALPSGEALLAWRGTDQKSYSSRYTGTWSAAVDVSGNNDNTICAPVLAPGATNAEAELVFIDAIGAARWTRLNGASWSPPSLSGTSSPPSCTSIAVSP